VVEDPIGVLGVLKGTAKHHTEPLQNDTENRNLKSDCEGNEMKYIRTLLDEALGTGFGVRAVVGELLRVIGETGATPEHGD
jgi:hypothetical protein